jgi:D-galactose 1-dehydrogenase/L-arabinose 1- dehydrogenase
MTNPIRLGLVGAGKIARDQHMAAIASNDSFRLVATADPYNSIPGVQSFASLGAMIAGTELDAVAISTPPAIRHDLACEAISAGLHLFLEKPPAATVTQALDLDARARKAGVTVFAAWHSREAAGVAAAQAWLASRQIISAKIEWKEDIRRWHPGQEWLLEPAGFGVFDPGINAFSILTAIMPVPVAVRAADLTIPAGRGAPISATVEMVAGDGAPISAELDFLQEGDQRWMIEVHTDRGDMLLRDGGAVAAIDGRETSGPDSEYARLYARFAALIGAGQSDLDVRPLQLVAHACLIGTRRAGAPFSF